jgi:hypothetical protein
VLERRKSELQTMKSELKSDINHLKELNEENDLFVSIKQVF